MGQHREAFAAQTSSFEPYRTPESELEVIETGFRFIEGPLWDRRADRLFFNDIKGNAIYTWDMLHGLSIFRDNSYLANGNAFDAQGNLLTCEHGTSRISKTTREGEYSVLVDRFEGRELNSPNDLIVNGDGVILFTDPPSGRGAGFGIPRERQLGFQGVYAFDPVSEKLSLLIDDLPFPNGLCLSADQRTLYVSDTVRGHIYSYHIDEQLAVTDCRLFAALPEDLPGKADGLKIDSIGNIFSTGPGGILIYDPSGMLIGRIFVPEQAANFCWGEEELKTLFITASTTLYAIRLGVSGC
ncbi:MAG: SMP-30/gluconolactonase/LRE family protein [Spirochaetia bacterium]|nr:SMP-30/gluconolactonase/LRE family protein [Spirochaetia bacterium]MCF7941814.1 SMP-30/gluconolactonase/LRE family protein [Spirochaetia bacterium]